MLYDLEKTRRHYRRMIEEKPPDYFERFDLDLLEKRPLVRALIEKEFQKLFPKKVRRVLDLGCGTCFYYPLLARHAERITGVDLCVPMLEQARELIRRKGLANCEVLESSAMELPLPDQSYDVVLSWDFLHHVQDVPGSIAEITRVLEPDGRYVALEPNIFNPSILWYHLRRKSEWRIFSQNQLSIPRMLRRSRFDVTVRYDNTIISFLNERTRPLWKTIDRFTAVPPFQYLSFRYILDCRRKNGESCEVGKAPGSWPVSAAVLALGAVLCLLLHESLFGGRVLTQADALFQFEPWASVAPVGYAPSNELLLDQSIGWVPWMDFQAEELRRFELPLWNPYNYCGEPLVGTYQSALYWPLSWVYHLWPSWHAHAWIAFAKLWFAGLFMVLFLRRLGLSGGASAVGGLGYMLCGFMVVWLNHPHSSAALFLPALCWSVERMAARPAAREAALFGLLVGLSFLAGHVQTSVHLALFIGLYVLFRALVPVGSARLAPRGIAGLSIGSFLGIVLAAPQLLPFLEYVNHSQAVGVFERMDTVARGGVTPAAVLMVDPDFYGAPHTRDYRGPLGPNLNYNELIGGYVGRVLLVLALLQAVRVFRLPDGRLLTLFCLGVVLAAGLVAFQVEPLYSFFDAIPMLRSTKLMRALLFVAFGLCVLAAMGLEAVVRGRRWRSWLLPALFCGVAAEQLSFARGYNPQVEPGLLLPRTRVTDFLRREQGDHRSLGTDNSILKPNANVFYRVSMVSGYDSMEDQAMAELVLRMTQRPPEFPFISQIGAFDRAEAFPLASLLGVKFFLGKTELPPPLRKVLDAELMVFENPQVMPRAFLAREVRVVRDKQERLDLLSSSGFDPWVAVLEKEAEAVPASDRDPTPCGEGPQGGAPAVSEERGGDDEVRVKSMRPREVIVHVRTGRRGLLVLSDVWDPGWTAEVRTLGTGDGEGVPGRQVPIERVDHALRGVWMEPGMWALRFRYDPLSTRLGLALGLGAAIALVALALLPRSRRGGSLRTLAGVEPAATTRCHRRPW